MSSSTQGTTTRREFIKTTSKLAAVSALANVAIPSVNAAGSDLIQVALIGCGGRGSGAAGNALSVKRGPMKLVAVADLFQERLGPSLDHLKQRYGSQVDVPRDRQFLGFDAYKQAIDCLRPGDIAIFATPPAFRWVHFTYAIEKGVNVFMEKPVTVDGPTSKRMLKLAQDASNKNLKVGVGLMSRHSRPLQELAKRVHDGAIGPIILQRGYRMHGPGGYFLLVFKKTIECADDSLLLFKRWNDMPARLYISTNFSLFSKQCRRSSTDCRSADIQQWQDGLGGLRIAQDGRSEVPAGLWLIFRAARGTSNRESGSWLG